MVQPFHLSSFYVFLTTLFALCQCRPSQKQSLNEQETFYYAEKPSVRFLRDLVQAVLQLDLEYEDMVPKSRVNRMLPAPDAIVAMQPTKWGGGAGALCTPEAETDCTSFSKGKSCHVKPSGGSCCICMGDYIGGDKRRKRNSKSWNILQQIMTQIG